MVHLESNRSPGRLGEGSGEEHGKARAEGQAYDSYQGHLIICHHVGFWFCLDIGLWVFFYLGGNHYS